MEAAKAKALKTNSERPSTGAGSSKIETVFVLDGTDWQTMRKNNQLCESTSIMTCFVFTKNKDNEWECQKGTGFGIHSLLDSNSGHFNANIRHSCTVTSDC